MNLSKLDKDIKQSILNIIDQDLLLITFYGKRKRYLMKGVVDDKGQLYQTDHFCERILVHDEKDISSYIKSKLKSYQETGQDNIFSSLYKSNYNNTFNSPVGYEAILDYELKIEDYDWLKKFNCLNLNYWDKKSVFVIDIEPFNQLKIV